MNVGVICGDRYHPCDVVAQGLENCTALYGPSALPDLAVSYIESTESWSNDVLNDLDIAVLCKANALSPTNFEPWLSADVQRAFADFVHRGAGLLVIHAGTVGYRDLPEFRDLIGGAFVHHPEPGLVTVLTRPCDALLEIGARVFVVHDEHYLMELYRDDLDVFMTSTSNHGTMPAGWVRTVGMGRVSVLTPGHYAPVWADPDYKEIISACLAWCAGATRP